MAKKPYPENTCPCCEAPREPLSLKLKCDRCGIQFGPYETALSVRAAVLRKTVAILVLIGTLLIGGNVVSWLKASKTIAQDAAAIEATLAKQVSDRIDEKFKEPQLEAAFDKAARLKAEEMMTGELEPQLLVSEEKIRQVAQSTVDIKTELDKDLEFERTLLGAASDDRKAWDALGKQGENTGFQYQRLAGSAWARVLEENTGDGFQMAASAKWDPLYGTQPTHLTPNTIQESYAHLNIDRPKVVAGFVLMVGLRTDLSSRARADFMMRVATTTTSVMVLRYAGISFLRLTVDHVAQVAKNTYPLLVTIYADDWKILRNQLRDDDAAPVPPDQK